MSRKAIVSAALGWSRLALAATTMVVLAGCATTKTPGTQIDDTAIKAKVESKLATNGKTNPFKIDVQVSEGVVHLAGVVDDAADRDLAVHEARSVNGVRRVINDLKVGDESAGQMVDDGAITAKVKAKLAASAQMNPFNIDVSTSKGVVSLDGRVKTAEDRAEAERIARETSGVRGVRNLLAVGDRSGG